MTFSKKFWFMFGILIGISCGLMIAFGIMILIILYLPIGPVPIPTYPHIY